MVNSCNGTRVIFNDSDSLFESSKPENSLNDEELLLFHSFLFDRERRPRPLLILSVRTRKDD